MTRTFLAIELPDVARAALTRERDALAREFPAIRWVNPASIHLTLAFLGEIDGEALQAATDAAQEAARTARPFSLAITGLGSFGSLRAPRVVWAGVTGEVAALQRLQATLVDALARRGFPREERPFSPHLTLARVKERLDAVTLDRLRAHIEAAATKRYATWRPEALHVMKSELLRGGARYTSLATEPFGG